MILTFVVIPAGVDEPVAAFRDRDDAVRWASARFEGAFRVEELVVRMVHVAVGTRACV
jgi:hypothetical protein